MFFVRLGFFALIAITLVSPVKAQQRETLRGDGWERVDGVTKNNANLHFVYVDPLKSYSDRPFEEAIASVCKPGIFCKIWFWTDKSQIPSSESAEEFSGFEMTKEQGGSQIGAYVFNPANGYKKFVRYSPKL